MGRSLLWPSVEWSCVQASRTINDANGHKLAACYCTDTQRAESASAAYAGVGQEDAEVGNVKGDRIECCFRRMTDEARRREAVAP